MSVTANTMSKVSRRLANLPAVFHYRDLEKLNYTLASARVVVTRWAQEHLIEPIGRRSGFYLNPVNPPPGPVWAALLPRLSPSSVIIGQAALFHAGWLAQLPGNIEIAIPNRKRFPVLEGITYVTWKRNQFRCLTCASDAYEGVPVLCGEAALLELLARAPRQLIDLSLQLPEGVSVDQIRQEADKLRQGKPFHTPRPCAASITESTTEGVPE